jgi:hypothetical protein
VLELRDVLLGKQVEKGAQFGEIKGHGRKDSGGV